MNKIGILALCWLIFVTAFIGGFVVYDTKSWPYESLIGVKAFILGHPSEELSIKEKILNDLNVEPTRHIKVAGIDKKNLSDNKELEGLPLNPRRTKPTIFLSERALKGYRVIYTSHGEGQVSDSFFVVRYREHRNFLDTVVSSTFNKFRFSRDSF